MTKTNEKHEIPIGKRAWYETARRSINSVVRGLEEVITNAATSYFRMGRPAEILISINEDGPRGYEISVRDEAEGMSAEELRLRLLPISPDESLDPADRGRGYFRRGLKDLATHGDVRVDTLKDGILSSVDIVVERNVPMSTDIVHEKASPQKLVSLFGSRPVKSGTVVTWYPRPEDGFRIRRYATLKEDISNSWALWRLCGDWDKVGHRICIRSIKHHPKAEQLKVDLPLQYKIVDRELDSRKEGAAATRLRLYWSEELLQDTAGIVVCGMDGVYDFPFLSRALRQDKNAEHIFGILDCESLDLLRSGAGVALIDPQRQANLDTNHPFVASLQREVEEIVRAEIESRKGPAKMVELPQDVSQRLEEVGRLIGNRMQEIEGSDTVGEPDEELPDLFVTPAAVVLSPLSTKSVYCYAKSTRPLFDVPPVFECVTSDDAIRVAMQPAVRWDARPDFWRSALQVTSSEEEGQYEVLIELRESTPRLVTLTVKVREEAQPRAVDTLSFEHDTYTARKGKRKRIGLRAPFGDGELLDEVPQVVSRDTESLPIVKPPTPFRFDRRTCDLVSVTEVQGNRKARGVMLEASADGALARSTVDVVTGDSGGRRPFRFNFDDGKAETRAKWQSDAEGETLWIFTQHPGTSLHLADTSPESKRDSKFLAVVAEIIVEYGALRLAAARCRRDGMDSIEPQMFVSRFEQEADRLAGPVQRLLQGGAT